MKITRRQLRRLIREQFRSRQSTYKPPRREFDEGQKLPLKDKGTGISSGEGMEREMVIETMKLIKKWRNLTRKHDLTDRPGEATFDSYIDSALKTVQGKIYNNDYSVPYDLPGLSEMKITRRKLRQIILQEMSDYHDFGIPISAKELQPQSMGIERGPQFPKEQEMFDASEKRHMEGGVQTKFLDWANQVLAAKGLPTAPPGDDSNLYQIGNSLLHGPPYDAWTSGVQPADYASAMEVKSLTQRDRDTSKGSPEYDRGYLDGLDDFPEASEDLDYQAGHEDGLRDATLPEPDLP